MGIGLYDIFFDEKSGLPKLKKVKTLKGALDIPYSTENIVELLNKELAFNRMRNEHAYVACLSFSDFLMGLGIMGIGDNKGVDISPITFGTYLLLMGADKFSVFHNHPAGTFEPSESDETNSIMLKGLASIYGIEMQDDVIVSNDGWYGLISKQSNYI